MLLNNRDASCLWDMYQAAKGIVKAMKGVDLERYITDENLRLMIERRIEIIGEAARRLSESFREAHPEIQWRKIINQRNFLIHAYDEIDDERIWRLTVNQIPDLLSKLTTLLPPLPKD